MPEILPENHLIVEAPVPPNIYNFLEKRVTRSTARSLFLNRVFGIRTYSRTGALSGVYYFELEDGDMLGDPYHILILNNQFC